MKRLTTAVGVVTLLACAGSGSPEADLPDTALLAVPADPAAAPQPIQAESLTRAPTQNASPAQTAPAQRAPAVLTPPPTQDPPRRQPPEPHDTRPSIPLPLDTI